MQNPTHWIGKFANVRWFLIGHKAAHPFTGPNKCWENKTMAKKQIEDDPNLAMHSYGPNFHDKFPANQIEWRIQQAGKTANGKPWGICLAYIDARAVMQRLDDCVGWENWCDKYIHIDGGVECHLSIRTVGDDWITKIDGSPETATEAFKGGYSKSLVRAAVKFGIGRYLYDLPVTFANWVDKNAFGAKRHKFKDNTFGYWTPPALPKEFLP